MIPLRSAVVLVRMGLLPRLAPDHLGPGEPGRDPPRARPEPREPPLLARRGALRVRGEGAVLLRGRPRHSDPEGRPVLRRKHAAGVLRQLRALRPGLGDRANLLTRRRVHVST